MDANGKLVPTMEGRPYAIYSLPLHERCDHPIASGPRALRLGPDASGALGQYMSAPQKMASGIRKASVREVLQVLENPKQPGYPSTVNADACLGYSVYAYQSSGVLFDAIGTRDDVLVRLEGLRCKGRNDKQNVCRAEKVGNRPCCAIPTHVGIPNSYVLGENDFRKQQAIDLWAAFGPWGAKTFSRNEIRLRKQ